MERISLIFNSILDMFNKKLDFDKVISKRESFTYRFWDKFFIEHKVDEIFLRKFIKHFQYRKDFINWDLISSFQVLSEDFMNDFEDEIDWYAVSYYQKMSKEFVGRHFNKLSPSIHFNPNISEEIKEFYKIFI
jgi:hypothetical protein